MDPNLNNDFSEISKENIDVIEEDADTMLFLMIIAWMQAIFYLLLKRYNSGNRRWWMLPDKRERHHLGVYATLFLKYKRTNHKQRFTFYTLKSHFGYRFKHTK